MCLRQTLRVRPARRRPARRRQRRGQRNDIGGADAQGHRRDLNGRAGLWRSGRISNTEEKLKRMSAYKAKPDLDDPLPQDSGKSVAEPAAAQMTLWPSLDE